MLRRVLRGGVPAATLLALLALLPGAPARGADGTLRILHVNDFHGELLPVRATAGSEEQGGAARLAALVRAERTPATLFLAAGDLMQGANLSNLFAGRPVIEAFNLMGLDASAVGNHEFDDGLPALAERAAEARFPFLAANIAGEGPWRPGVLREVGGLRVGIFGLTTEETPVATHPRNVAGLGFGDPVEAARRMVAELRPQADLVVALTHLGHEEDARLAAAVPGIDVVVGGHTHTRVEQPLRVGSTLVVQAFERGAVLGRLDLEVHDGAVAARDYRLVPVTAAAGEDPEVAALVASYAARLDARMAEPVGTAVVDLDGDKARTRSGETNLGDLVADVMRDAAGADVALVNGGTIRAGIPAGPVSVGAVYNVLPFDNWVVAFTLTGEELRRALETGVSRVEAGDGGFPQVSGMRFVFDPSAPAGSRIVSVSVGGEPLEAGRRYVLATHDFLAAGGNGYEVFAGKAPVYNDAGRWLRDLLVAWWREHGEVAARTDGRIGVAP